MYAVDCIATFSARFKALGNKIGRRCRGVTTGFSGLMAVFLEQAEKDIIPASPQEKIIFLIVIMSWIFSPVDGGEVF